LNSSICIYVGYREKVVTPEMLEEKAKKLQKRKQLADEKREHDKVSTEYFYE
jgi:INO80 complex subunit B